MLAPLNGKFCFPPRKQRQPAAATLMALASLKAAIALLFVACLDVRAQNAVAELEQAYFSCAEKVTPSVVSIISMTASGVVSDPNLLEDPFAEQKKRFFGEKAAQVGMNVGSGAIIDPKGYILTNEHVCAGNSKVGVMLSDGRRFEATVLGAHSMRDLAVLKIEAGEPLKALEWAPAEEVKVLQFAIAFGYPYAIGEDPKPTASAGHVSAVNRATRSHDRGRDFTGLIQTDAAINPGNSGGPLVDIHGRMIGVNVAIASMSGGFEGIGFAVPFDRQTLEIIERLKSGESVRKPWMGFSAGPVDRERAKSFGATPGKGILIESVVPDSPAAMSGLRKGDILLSFGEQDIDAPDTLAAALKSRAVGDKVALGVLRDGARIRIEMTLGEVVPDSPSAAPSPRFWRGAKIVPLPQSHKDANGVMVEEVAPDTPAWKAGLRPGDVIDEVNRNPVKNLAEFLNAVRPLDGQDILLHTDKGYRPIEKR